MGVCTPPPVTVTGLPLESTMGAPAVTTEGPRIGELPASPDELYCALSVKVGSSAFLVVRTSIPAFFKL